MLPLRPRTRAAAKTARITQPILANVFAAVGFAMHVSALLLPVVLLLASTHARADDAEVQRGRAVIERFGCAACHVIPGIRGARGLVGPPLTKLGSRIYIAGILPNTPESLTRWLLDPPSINPGTAMPSVGLDEAQARAAAAYLSTLR